MWLLALMMTSGLTVEPGKPALQRLEKNAVGAVTFEVAVTNTGSDSVTLQPSPLAVFAGEKQVATCRYQRAVVTKTAGEHRRFTTFKGTLKAGERVELRLFFQWPDKTPLPKGPLAYELSVPSDGAVVKTRSRTFEPEDIRGI